MRSPLVIGKYFSKEIFRSVLRSSLTDTIHIHVPPLTLNATPGLRRDMRKQGSFSNSVGNLSVVLYLQTLIETQETGLKHTNPILFSKNTYSITSAKVSSEISDLNEYVLAVSSSYFHI